jgi:hypothetical protein
MESIAGSGKYLHRLVNDTVWWFSSVRILKQILKYTVKEERKWDVYVGDASSQ